MSRTTFSAIASTIWQRGRTVAKGWFVLVVLFTGIAIVGNSLPYFSSINAGFLRTKADVLPGTAYLPAFYGHISVGFIVLATGLLQFSRRMRCRFKRAHRLAGKIYVVLVLVVMAPSGLVMGIYANGGFATQLCFVLLAGVWWYYTARAYQAIRRGNVTTHVAFTYRSYALTLSAITLRLYSFLAVYYWGLQGPEVYRVLVWLSWIPNGLLVELYLAFKLTRSTVSSSPLPAARAGAPIATK